VHLELVRLQPALDEAGTRAEAVLGRALAGQRREGLESCTKVYWPTGPGRNDRGLSRKPITESATASLRRLQTDYLDLYQAHRYDSTVPLEETMTAFADLVRSGKVLYVGVSEWRAEEIAAGTALARELGIQLISNQPQYSMIYRVIEGEVVPTSKELGISQSPVREALRDLAAIGIITIHSRRGARVRMPTSKELGDVSLVRSEIDALAARLAVPELDE